VKTRSKQVVSHCLKAHVQLHTVQNQHYPPPSKHTLHRTEKLKAFTLFWKTENHLVWDKRYDVW